MAPSTSRATRGAARTTSIATLVLALAALAPAAAATETADRTTLDLLAQAQAGHAVSATGWSAPVTAAQAAPDNDCFEDAEGDTFRFGTPPVPEEEPRADIIQHCANYGPTLSLALTPADPTDPGSDENWNGATFAGWFIDIDDDEEGEFFATLHLDADSQLIGEVIDISGDDPALSCNGAASASTTTYAISDIGPDCIGDATTIRVSPAMWYDTRPAEGSGGGRFYDVDPDSQDPDNPSQFRGPTSGGEDRPTRRLGGEDRIETAVEISQGQFPTPPVDIVFIARADIFIDAVTGGVLTAGPILLVPSCGPIPGVVRAEIDRLDPGTVIALGREQAVCEQTLLLAAAGRDTGRLGGPTRIGTSVEISEFQFDPGEADHVYIARTDPYADAVVGGVLTEGPILLVPRCDQPVPDIVLAEIDRLDPEQVIALGEVVAVCEDTLEAAAQGRTTDRLGGDTRIETAIEISRFAFPGNAPFVFISRDGRVPEAPPPDNDNVFADAAVGGTLTTGPILLVPTCGDLPPGVGAEISRVAPSQAVVALGRELAVCPEMLEQAARH
ncbi:MAG: cell wall-binding repeat-containing protein [Actinobacteria bacterium]|nr:cell wall-binding repeat-containing protein [Actinomycetota bacterium]